MRLSRHGTHILDVVGDNELWTIVLVLQSAHRLLDRNRHDLRVVARHDNRQASPLVRHFLERPEILFQELVLLERETDIREVRFGLFLRAAEDEDEMDVLRHDRVERIALRKDQGFRSASECGHDEDGNVVPPRKLVHLSLKLR